VQRATKAPVRRQRQPRLQFRRPERIADALIDDRPRSLDDLRGRSKIGAEHRPHDDALGEIHHFRHEVDCLAALGEQFPSVEGAFSGLDHRVYHLRDALAVERWLREAPLSPPERVFAGDEAFPNALLEPFVQRTLVIVAVVVLQNVLDVVRGREQVAVVRAYLQVDQVTIAVGCGEKHIDRIRPHLRKHSDDGEAARAWRTSAREAHRAPQPL
jgi:hypothetical protein